MPQITITEKTCSIYIDSTHYFFYHFTMELAKNSIATNDKVRNQARQMYFSNIPIIDIVDSLNIDINELGLYVFGENRKGDAPSCWAYRKLNRPTVSVETYTAVKPVILKHTEALLMNRIRKSAQKLEEEDAILDMAGIDTATKIVERIDKITRLEEGKATQNIAVEKRSYTLREISDMTNTTKPQTIDISPSQQQDE